MVEAKLRVGVGFDEVGEIRALSLAGRDVVVLDKMFLRGLGHMLVAQELVVMAGDCFAVAAGSIFCQ